MDVKKDANKEMGGRKNFCVLIVMEAGGSPIHGFTDFSI